MHLLNFLRHRLKQIFNTAISLVTRCCTHFSLMRFTCLTKSGCDTVNNNKFCVGVCGNYRLCPACRLHNVHVGSCLAGSALCLEVTHNSAAQYAVATRRFVCVKFCYCAPVKTVTFGRTISFKQGLPCVSTSATM